MSNDDIVTSLSAKRAEVTRDCRKWSVLDALRETIKRIENNEADPDMVFIALRESEDGKAFFPSIAAGGTNIELAGLLAMHQHLLAEH